MCGRVWWFTCLCGCTSAGIEETYFTSYLKFWLGGLKSLCWNVYGHKETLAVATQDVSSGLRVFSLCFIKTKRSAKKSQCRSVGCIHAVIHELRHSLLVSILNNLPSYFICIHAEPAKTWSHAATMPSFWRESKSWALQFFRGAIFFRIFPEIFGKRTKGLFR